MTRHIPEFLAMFDRLLATPSVSCTEPRWDEGNLGVIELLAEWTGTLGFRCEIQPLPRRADKANLIAVLGEGPGGLVLSDVRRLLDRIMMSPDAETGLDALLDSGALTAILCPVASIATV